MRAIPERLRSVFTTWRYTNPRLPYLTLLLCWMLYFLLYSCCTRILHVLLVCGNKHSRLSTLTLYAEWSQSVFQHIFGNVTYSREINGPVVVPVQ